MNKTLKLNDYGSWEKEKIKDGKEAKERDEGVLPEDYLDKVRRKTLKIPFIYNKFFIFLKAKFDGISELATVDGNKINSKYIDRINKLYNAKACELYKLNYQILAHSLEAMTRYRNDIGKNEALISYEKKINVRPEYLKEERFIRKKAEYIGFLQGENKDYQNKINQTKKFLYYMCENDQYLLGQLRSELDEKIRLYIDWAGLANKNGLEAYVFEKPKLKEKYAYHYDKHLKLGQADDIKKSDDLLIDIVDKLDLE